MDCLECERLGIMRESRRRIWELATLRLNAAATSGDSAQFMRLKTLADEAKLDLELADAEIAQHQARHPRPA